MPSLFKDAKYGQAGEVTNTLSHVTPHPNPGTPSDSLFPIGRYTEDLLSKSLEINFLLRICLALFFKLYPLGRKIVWKHIQKANLGGLPWWRSG